MPPDALSLCRYLRRRMLIFVAGLMALSLFAGAAVPEVLGSQEVKRFRYVRTDVSVHPELLKSKSRIKMDSPEMQDPFYRIRWRRKWGRDGMGREYGGLSEFGHAWLMEIADRLRRVWMAVRELAVKLFTGKLNRKAIDEIRMKYIRPRKMTPSIRASLRENPAERRLRGKID